MIQLDDLKQLPKEIVCSDIGGDVDHIIERMENNGAVWHKSCRNKVDNQKVIRAKRKHDETIVSSSIKTRTISSESETMSTGSHGDDDIKTCIFCGEVGEIKRRGSFHKAATFGLHSKVCKCAETLGDRKLISKLSAGDMIAIDAEYHLSCLTKLYRAASGKNKEKENAGLKIAEGQAFNDLIDFVDQQRGE